MDGDPKVSGGVFEEATPDPIPNSEVKLLGADGTAREAVWESRTLPGFFPESPLRRALFFCLYPLDQLDAAGRRRALGWRCRDARSTDPGKVGHRRRPRAGGAHGRAGLRPVRAVPCG